MKTGTVISVGSKKMILEKLPAVGQKDQGYEFDSGCNPRGVKKVAIACGSSSNDPSVRHVYRDDYGFTVGPKLYRDSDYRKPKRKDPKFGIMRVYFDDISYSAPCDHNS
jgi:hypothetical protein